MKVFNLTSSPVDYRGKVIPPFGNMEFPKLTNLSESDMRLVGVLSYGTLPPGWVPPSVARVELASVEEPKKEPLKIQAQEAEKVPEAKPEDVQEVTDKKDFSKKYKK